MFDRCYCINSTIYLLKFVKLHGTIFVTVWPPASECTFFKHPSSWPERIKRFKMAAIIRFDLDISKMTVQGGCCTTVVCKSINKNGERSTEFTELRNIQISTEMSVELLRKH